MGKSIFQLSSKTSVLTNSLSSPRFSSKKKVAYSITTVAIAGSFLIASGAALTQSPTEELPSGIDIRQPTDTFGREGRQPTSSSTDSENSSTSQKQEDNQAGSNTDDANQNSVSDANTGSHMEVTVNGETIPIPQNGSVKKSVQNSDGNAEVSITVQNSQISSAPSTRTRSSQSSSITIDTTSKSSVQTKVNEEVRMR